MPTSPLTPVLFLSHGGGPLPLLGDPDHAGLIAVLKGLVPDDKPEAILLISAHWEEAAPTVTSAAKPGLIYDYFGFPSAAYSLQYPAPGSPALADRVARVLSQAGIAAQQDDQRGFDHGLFVPLSLMYPAADIPCVQLSLAQSLSPKRHIQIGKALAELRRDKVLIIGSGFTFHNLREFFAPQSPQTQALNESFEAWLKDTCANPGISEAEREQRLIEWDKAPAARYCHPREEHLLPLHVCYGAAGAPCRQVFEFTVLGKKASAYRW